MYTEINAQVNVTRRDPGEVKEPIYDEVQEWLDDWKKSAPAELETVLQDTGLIWALIPTEKAFVRSALQGIALAIFFAFTVLLISTGNVVQAVISILCVGVIIISVVCIMVLKEWELGTIESISVVITIGFSVDYVIHLSNDYMHASAESRHAKMKQAYTEMGISILSGAITPFVAGIPLFGGKLIFFTKFGVLICFTVAISFFVSMALFGAVIHICGPQNGFSNIYSDSKPKRKKVKPKRTPQQKDKVTRIVEEKTRKLQ